MKKRILKYEKVKRLILNKIARGEYPKGTRLPTQLELPSILKTGAITVRRVMDDLARDGVIVRRRRSGTFVVEHGKPPIIPGRNLHLGLVWPDDIAPQYLHDRFNGAMTLGALASWGLDHVTPQWKTPALHEATAGRWDLPARALKVTCFGQAVRSRERHPPLRILADAQLDGLICFSIIEDQWLDQLVKLGPPVVLADYPTDRYRHAADQVFADPLPGFRQAIHTLAGQGIRKFHFLGVRLGGAAPSDTVQLEEWLAKYYDKLRDDPDSLLREFAFRRIITELGLPFGETSIHRLTYDSGDLERFAEKLFKLPKNKQPEAIVCNDIMHARFLEEFYRTRGRQLKTLGVCGVLEAETHENIIPIYCDGYQMGMVAAELLISRLLRPERPHLSVGVTMKL